MILLIVFSLLTANAGQHGPLPYNCRVLETEALLSLRPNDFVSILFIKNGETKVTAGLFSRIAGDYFEINEQLILIDQIRELRRARIGDELYVAHGVGKSLGYAAGIYRGFDFTSATITLGDNKIKLTELVDFNGPTIQLFSRQK